MGNGHCSEYQVKVIIRKSAGRLKCFSLESYVYSHWPGYYRILMAGRRGRIRVSGCDGSIVAGGEG